MNIEERRDKINKEAKILWEGIPKEYHRAVKKLTSLNHELGAMSVLEIVRALGEVPPNDVQSYGVWHDSAIDGG